MKILSTLKEHIPSLQLEAIMIDFERAALNALELNFPIAELQGCGFQPRYRHEDEFAVTMKRFRALAFVHAIDVIPSYEEEWNELFHERIIVTDKFILLSNKYF